MTQVIFYEKPGCINNTKQKAMLVAAGHDVRSLSLLATSWTAASLRPFFGNLPPSEWFNRTAPRIKSGEINPDLVDEKTALELMIADPLLIRRPLIQVGDAFAVGFNLEKIDAWIGLNPVESKHQDLETCPHK